MKQIPGHRDLTTEDEVDTIRTEHLQLKRKPAETTKGTMSTWNSQAGGNTEMQSILWEIHLDGLAKMQLDLAIGM